MKHKAILSIVLLIVAGCAGNNGFSKPIVTLMQEERQFVTDILMTTDPQTLLAETCFFETLIGPRMELFPAYFKDGFFEMKEMLMDAESLGPCEIAMIHGIRWQLGSVAVQDVIKTHLPDILRFIPVWLLFP